MKYGIRDKSLQFGWDEAFAVAAGIGFDGVEICVTQPEHMPGIMDAAARTELRRRASESGVEICAISFGLIRRTSFIDADPDIRERGVQVMHDVIAAAKDLGCAAILCPTFDRQKIDLDSRETAAYVDCLKQCAPEAEREDILIALETSFSVELLAEVVTAVDSSHVQVYQDLSNALFYGHDTVDMLTRLRDHIGMIHIKETDQKPLGEGDVDWDGSLQAIRDTGYDGWLVFETSPGDEPVSMAERNLNWLKCRF